VHRSRDSPKFTRMSFWNTGYGNGFKCLYTENLVRPLPQLIDLSWNTIEHSLTSMYEKLVTLGLGCRSRKIQIFEPEVEESLYHATKSLSLQQMFCVTCCNQRFIRIPDRFGNILFDLKTHLRIFPYSLCITNHQTDNLIFAKNTSVNIFFVR